MQNIIEKEKNWKAHGSQERRRWSSVTAKHELRWTHMQTSSTITQEICMQACLPKTDQECHSGKSTLVVAENVYQNKKVHLCPLTGWNRMQSCEETPYITLMQSPLEISHTLTVLSIEDDAMYWLFVEKSKSGKGQICKW